MTNGWDASINIFYDSIRKIMHKENTVRSQANAIANEFLSTKGDGTPVDYLFFRRIESSAKCTLWDLVRLDWISTPDLVARELIGFLRKVPIKHSVAIDLAEIIIKVMVQKTVIGPIKEMEQFLQSKSDGFSQSVIQPMREHLKDYAKTEEQ